MALAGIELHQQSWRAHDAFAPRGRDLGLTAQDRDPSSLVDLVILQALTRRNGQSDGARIGRGREDLRSVWLQL